jgi:hypothetical protein
VTDLRETLRELLARAEAGLESARRSGGPHHVRYWETRIAALREAVASLG